MKKNHAIGCSMKKSIGLLLCLLLAGLLLVGCGDSKPDGQEYSSTDITDTEDVSTPTSEENTIKTPVETKAPQVTTDKSTESTYPETTPETEPETGFEGTLIPDGSNPEYSKFY